MSFDSSRSANSGNKSKRSFNSISSNPSNNGNNNSNSNNNNNSKKNKTQQKTLGVAWGSNSRSSSRSSFRSSPFSDFGSYMVVKNQKLEKQFDAEASNSSHSGSDSGKLIFSGVSIFVDGFTVPSSQELRGFMLKYGGRFENYFSRRRVTHIICSNLPDSKIKNLRSFSRGLPVVKPTWVLDSVAANRLLSWAPYQIDQLANESRNQPKLSAFFTSKTYPDAEDAANNAICHVIPETEDSTLRGGKLKEAALSEVDDLIKNTRQFSGESNNPVRENLFESSIEEPTSSCGNISDFKMAGVGKADTENQSAVKNESSPLRPSTSAASYCLDDKGVKGLTSFTVLGPSNQRHSTAEDPNFVENYFKSSRLHFIGTWRNRYRKRFMGLSKGTKLTSSKLNASANARKTSIIHVDMDCFFVSVVIRNHPEIRDKPVAVCHSDNPRGTAEISSANYPARDYGIKAGIFVRDAKALCPHLVIFPYNFEAYEEVADQFYNILHQHCSTVQAVSCDEAFLEVADSDEEDPELLASILRKEILETTGCTASAGIAGNMLMARLATRTAKPDGQCHISPEKVFRAQQSIGWLNMSPVFMPLVGLFGHILSKLSTDKPISVLNGCQFVLSGGTFNVDHVTTLDMVDDYLCELPIKQLPGIGHVLEEKLKTRQVRTCGQLRLISKETLQKDFGIKTGDMLWHYSRGIDNRLVGLIQESKSIGAEVNWGVRFKDLKDSHHFIINLCKEVSLRLQGCGVQGRTFTMKIKKRRKDAVEPAKYMGCGDCENLSHSMTVPVATDDLEVLQRIAKQLFGAFHIDVQEIRGVGLQVCRLENADTAKQGSERKSLKSWLTSASASPEEQCNIKSPTKKSAEVVCQTYKTDGDLGQLCGESVQPSCRMGNISSSSEAGLNQVSELPPLCHLDVGVIESLPPELFSEINEMYSGKLIDFIAKNKGSDVNINIPFSSPSYERAEDIKGEGERHALSHLHSLKKMPVENEVVTVSGEGSSHMVLHTSHLEQTDLMPSSLSQIDPLVLQQLPEELRVGILEVLPAHRMAEHASNAALDSLGACPHEALGVEGIENSYGLVEYFANNNIWTGNPPQWVDMFKVSNSSILKILAELYSRLGGTDQFSSVLQRTISELSQSLYPSCDGCDEAIQGLSELLKQYIKLKIESDIEEIYLCFCLLRRLRMKSKVFLEAYNVVYPYLQASFGESYGGNLPM